MDQLISQYLFQHSVCPLPGVGTLMLIRTNAAYRAADQVLQPPAYSINLSDDETDPAHLIRFIANLQKIEPASADKKLREYCRRLSSMKAEEEWVVSGTGRFLSDTEGKLCFEADTLPDHFMQYVPAVRVIRNDANHSITVGDRERDSQEMSELLSAGKKKRKRLSGQIVSYILVLVSLLLILLYLREQGSTTMFGNKTPLKLKQEPAQYLQKGL